MSDQKMDTSQRADLEQMFEVEFQKKATYAFFCPGRVNLIGEHIDYNGGMVMPVAIDLGTYLLAAPNEEGVFRFRSANYQEQLDCSNVSELIKKDNSWFYFPAGIIRSLQKKGYDLKPLDMLFFGDLPVSAGLSSSASIEVLMAFALNEINKLKLDRLSLVKLAKSVENEFIGVNRGIMDQFAVGFGEEDKALLLNCETLDHSTIPFHSDEYQLVIINTNKPRKLAESKYNERVAECNAAISGLKPYLEIGALCDLDTEVFNTYQHVITDPIARRRARHVVEENQRVSDAAKALSHGDFKKFGKLMYESHSSLKENYEVTGPELDAIVDFSLSSEAVIGARMTGAGFGGCAIALVKNSGYPRFESGLKQDYVAKFGYQPDVYPVFVSQGVRVFDLAMKR